MKQKTYLFIAISSVALLIVLSIQVNWILQTAKIKEQLFNEKANMVLSRTTEAIGADKETLRKIEACVGESDGSPSSVQLGDSETHKIDSLLVHYMKFYNFHVDYSFEVMKSIPSKAVMIKFNDKDANNLNTGQQACYQNSLDEMVNENGWELKLILPDKKKFILAEMRMPFLASVFLILIVLVLFWRTVLSLTRRKKYRSTQLIF